MADKKISDLTSATSIATTDFLEIETAAGNSRKVTGLVASTSFRGFVEGTSFPLAPTTGDRFWRSDLKMMAVFDGTRWLSQQVFTANAGSVAPGATVFLAFGTPFVDTYDIYLENLTVVSQITSATTGTNYFTWQWQSQTNTGTNVGSAQSSQSDTQNLSVTRTQAINSVIDMTSGQKWFLLTLTKVAAGNGNFAAAMSYRLVIT